MGNEADGAGRAARSVGPGFRLILFVCAIALLVVVGPPVLNRLERALGTIPTPPARPPQVPPDAVISQQAQGWWWLSCRELGDVRYRCRVFDERGDVVVAGEFKARPHSYRQQKRTYPGRLPDPGERFSAGAYSDGHGVITAGSARFELVPEGWVFHPSRGTKAQVKPDGWLSRETAMSAQERAEYGSQPAAR